MDRTYETSLRKVIIKNLDKFHIRPNSIIKELKIERLGKQNIYSNRKGGRIKILYECDGSVYQKNLWAKRIKYPKKAYNKIVSVYGKLKENEIQQQVPETYLYDNDLQIIVTDELSGTNIFKKAVAYVIPNFNFICFGMPEQIYKIGNWLQKYHESVQTGVYIQTGDQITFLIDWLRKATDIKNKQKILKTLMKLSEDSITSIQSKEVIPHNDFSLRNIFVSKNQEFNIIDWDAMVHPAFPGKTWCWYDLSYLIINIQSLIRFFPITRIKKINILCDALLRGYFENAHWLNGVCINDFKNKIFYIQTIKLYLGIETDRKLSRIYNRRLTSRYIALLEKRIKYGSTYIN